MESKKEYLKKYNILNKEKIQNNRKQYYQKNKEVIKQKNKKYVSLNLEKVNKYKHKWYLENIDSCKKKAKENSIKNRVRNNLLRSLWKKKNRNKFNKQMKKDYDRRYNSDLSYKLPRVLRSRLRHALKNNQKKGSAVKDLGCTIPELKIHLEKQFKDGMTWENWGEWHIDHKIPLSKMDLTNREELLKAVNYTNLQPLWAIDNIKKGDILLDI